LNFAKKLRKKQGKLGDSWYADEVFLTINGNRQYLWRAVDQDGDAVDILVQSRRNKKAALRFFRKMLKHQGVPRKIVTDKLRSYGAARKEIMPSVIHCQEQYANNRAEGSHQHTGQQECQMRRFKSPGQAQLFCPFTVKFTIFFVSVAIFLNHVIIGCSVLDRLILGNR